MKNSNLLLQKCKIFTYVLRSKKKPFLTKDSNTSDQ